MFSLRRSHGEGEGFPYESSHDRDEDLPYERSHGRGGCFLTKALMTAAKDLLRKLPLMTPYFNCNYAMM